ncbi:hypothetical protein [Enterobacter genomosp. O]|uniref:hypothetical protein n=1 Tax=Enterobacter genomosp. O TaxID=2364150 RepID=UPI00064298FA|nr:hypothetical protein [Enterobacter genomosp. O]KLP61159.1 hypothetical protein ABR39_00695 [Enterobacter genomosp. O]
MPSDELKKAACWQYYSEQPAIMFQLIPGRFFAESGAGNVPVIFKIREIHCDIVHKGMRVTTLKASKERAHKIAGTMFASHMTPGKLLFADPARK